MAYYSSKEIQDSLSESLSFAFLCSLEPAGVPFETYHQKLGSVRYTSQEFQTPEIIRFVSSPLYLASGILPNISDLVAYEMTFDRGLGSDGWLGVIARYPFAFVSYALQAEGQLSKPWDLLQDLTFTHFVMFGGKTGVDNDVVGYVISQESVPGLILESAAFQTPSSVIAPGYSDQQIALVRSQEDACLRKLKATKNSILSSFIDELADLDISGVALKVLYGVSTAPFNDIDKVISKIRKPRKTKSL